jgi:cell division protease FtsH
MSPLVGPLNLAEETENQALVMTQRSYSEATAQVIDSEVKRIVEECLIEARDLLSRNRDKLEALTLALLRDESLDEDEILKVTGLPPKPGSKVVPPAAAPSADGAPPAVPEPVLPAR